MRRDPQGQGGGRAEIGSPEAILRNSEIAPPIVHLARALDLPAISLTVRDMRRTTETFRRSASIPNPKPAEEIRSELIHLSGVSLSYGNTRALNQVSLSIGEGEIVAIMGRNGAGKSTLLRSIAGILSPAHGTVSVLGNNPSTLHGKERRIRIGFIPQEPSDLLYGQSVLGECTTADQDNEIDSGSTFELLKSLVPDISPNTHPRDLSEGQRLALALSIVLSSNPKVVILDEPTRGLDYSAKASLVSTLQSTASHGCAIILATHDVELVAEVATRVVFIADGEIVADGRTVDVLLSSPAFAPQVAKIMSPVPWLTVKDVVDAIRIPE
jgi:energy-coupling factor transport system ATP-binding protein